MSNITDEEIIRRCAKILFENHNPDIDESSIIGERLISGFFHDLEYLSQYFDIKPKAALQNKVSDHHKGFMVVMDGQNKINEILKRQNKVSDPSTEQSTSNWKTVGDKDKFLDEVRGKESDVSAIVSDDEINKAWAYANFGSQSKRSVIIETLKKVAQGWGTGHTAMCIVKELGLVEKRNNQDGLSDKGLEYLIASIVNERKDNVGNDAVEFAEWLFGEGYTQYDGKERWINFQSDNHVYSTKELYKIFQESQPQQKEV